MSEKAQRRKRTSTPSTKRNDALPPDQAEACRMRMLEGLTHDEIARRLSVHRVTVTKWEGRPAFQAYARQLEADRHRVVVEAHHRVATRGAQLRLRVLEKIEAALDAIGVSDDVVGPDENPLPPYVDTEALARIATALDRLTTSAEDRAGFVARKAVEVSGPAGAPVQVAITPADLLAMPADKLRALAQVDPEPVDGEPAK